MLENSLRTEPAATDLATKRAIRILDAKYAKANIPAEIEKNCNHLNNANQEKLLELLLEFEELFDGTLGEWKTTPAKLELKPDKTLVHGAFYPVPMVHKDECKKEV